VQPPHAPSPVAEIGAKTRQSEQQRDRVNFGAEALHYRIEHPREPLSMSFFLIGCEFVDQLLGAALEC
jgi:hypothetical protein